MPRTEWTPWILPALALLATGCATEPSRTTVVKTPDLIPYHADVQARAADELGQLGPPCPRDTVIEGCSAVHRLVVDYGFVRDQIRAARE